MEKFENITFGDLSAAGKLKYLDFTHQSEADVDADMVIGIMTYTDTEDDVEMPTSEDEATCNYP